MTRNIGWGAGASVLAAIVLVGCGASTKYSADSSQKSRQVNVVYAGSLAYINDNVLGPAFQKDTGIAYRGRGGGSFAMARQLAAHLIPGDVFESVGTAPVQTLEPKQTTWAVRVSATPLIIAYNPKSPDAAYFKRVATGKVGLKSFFEFLAAHPRLHIGRTNPETDPQGQAFYEMVELAVLRYHLPSNTVKKILGGWNNPKQVYSEEGLPTELESGGLDLASAFLPEAIQSHLAYIPLPGFLNFAVARDGSWYARAHINLPTGTVSGGVLGIWATVLNKNRAGTQFVRYLLTHEKMLKQYGYPPLSPAIQGRASAVPPSIPHA